MRINSESFTPNILNLIKAPIHEVDHGYIVEAYPAVGSLFVSKNNLSYITGYVRTRGRNGGKYPYNYLEMIDAVFGYEDNTIEVCSNSVKGCFTVDINPAHEPNLVSNAETLEGIENNSFSRYRVDPPYSEYCARKMYNTGLPSISKLLKAGARVCKPKALMFLLLGNVNRQSCPTELKRIGYVAISVIPSNELRCLHIYHKLPNELALDYELPEVKIKAQKYNNQN